jgi:hypothetical protein
VLHDAIIRYGGYRGGEQYLVWVNGGGAATFELRNCTLEKAYDKVILNSSPQAIWVHHNAVTGAGIAGTGVSGSMATVQDNVFSGLSYAINVDGVATVERNTISGCDWAVYLSGGGSSAVRDNVLTGNNNLFYQGPGSPVYSGNVLGSGNRARFIGVGGSLAQNVTWGNGLGLPYHVTDDLTVPSGRTLTIEAGTVVKFGPGQHSQRRLLVQGTLQLNSTASQKVVFTSAQDDTYGGDSNGDGGATSPNPWDWGYIRYDNPANVLHDAIIRYGGYRGGEQYLVWVNGGGAATFELRNCTLEKAYDKGMFVSGPATVVVTSSTFDFINGDAVHANAGQLSLDYSSFSEYGTAVRFAGSATGTALRCNFYDANKDYGVLNETSTPVNATGNWWSSATGPSDSGPGSGVKVSGNVLFSGWKTAPITGPNATGPQFTSTPSRAGIVGLPYAYDADRRASASGQGPFTWAKVYGPADFSIDASTGLVNWTPASPGSYLIGLQVSDASGADAQLFTVQVGPSGDIAPPRVTSFNAQMTATLNGINASLTVVFDEPVLVGANDFALLNAANQTVPLGSYTYSVASNSLLVSAANLAPGQTYRLMLTDNITDLSFNALDGEFNGYAFSSGNGVAGGRYVAEFTTFGSGAPASPSLARARRAAPGSFQFSVGGELWRTYRIEASTNLLNWVPVYTNSSSTGAIDFTDTDAPLHGRRFYRAIVVP